MQIHHAMTFVVSLGMIETCVWYYDYSNFNTTDFDRTCDHFCGHCFCSSEIRFPSVSLSRFHGLRRRSTDFRRVRAESTRVNWGYFIASATLDVVANVGAIDDLTSGARVFGSTRGCVRWRVDLVDLYEFE